MAKKSLGSNYLGSEAGTSPALDVAAHSVRRAIDEMRAEFVLPPREAESGMGVMQPPPATKIAWDDDFRVGVPLIDTQHEALLELVNRLVDHPEADVRSEAITEMLSRLGKSLSAHFDVEEALMYSSDMPTELIASHVQAHSRILDDYVAINLAAALGENVTAAEIFARAQDWVVGHVATFDRQIKDHIRPA
jgi:hemerythrin-like metal-binding protein